VIAARRWLRAGLTFLAVTQGAAGAVQLLFPELFYRDFPIQTHAWVAMLPPYNEHLMRDVGAGTLAYTLVLAVATITMERHMVRAALAANLAFSLPHFLFHAVHLGGMPLVDAITQTATLALAVVLPAVLLIVSMRLGGIRCFCEKTTGRQPWDP